MNTSKQKRALREQVRASFENLPFMALVEKTAHLRNFFDQVVVNPYQHWLTGKYIVSFYPFENEAQLNIEDERQNEPYRVGYVRIDDWGNRVMQASAARRDQPGQWEEIEPVAGLRIFQPHAQQARCQADEVSVILVPGIAFTRGGERLGRGAGFYDRFLVEYPHALRVGLAFSEQMVESLPTEDFDQKLDIVLTDSAVFETKRFGEWQKHGKIETR